MSAAERTGRRRVLPRRRQLAPATATILASLLLGAAALLPAGAGAARWPASGTSERQTLASSATAHATSAATSHQRIRHLRGLGPVHTVAGRRSVVRGRATPAQLRSYAALADLAARRVRAAWPDRGLRRLVLIVPRTTRQAARMLGVAPGALSGLAAVTATSRRPTGPARTRVVLNPAAFARLSDVGRRIVLTHEAVHVATRAATTPRTPRWLVEGVADWVAYRFEAVPVRRAGAELLASVRAGGAPRQLPARQELLGRGHRRVVAYEGAWLACRLIARHWGTGELIALYRSAGQGHEGQGQAGQGQGAAMRTVLRTSTPAFTARWRHELRRLAR